MRFALLGPLTVTDDAGKSLEPGGPRQRVLLAALLLHANVLVPAEALAEMVWDGSARPAAVTTLRSYVKRLRLALGPDAAARVVTRNPGYLIRVDQPELDVAEFEALCREAGTALRAGEWAGASAAATRASRLWRAAPLLDVPSDVLRDQFVPRLERLRLQVLDDGCEAGLRLGQHRELVPRLLDLVAQHPLRERFHAQLMLALTGSGRQAEALDAYRKARRALIDELGTEPGPELSELHQRILAGDIRLAAPRPQSAESSQADPAPAETAPAQTASATAVLVPRQLPAAAAHFTGRGTELAALDALLGQVDGQRPGAVVISAIGGAAGVGKTALALCWAHRVAPRFPDGQLYVNLRGYDPDQPMPAADALAGFLRALGLPGQQVPADTQERAASYRSLLAGQRMLVLLDNASAVEQVRPLLPGSGECVVVVTSRDPLAGLVARDGAQRLDLGLLPLADAVALLRALIGTRADAEPAAARELARQCALLPLALRVAAELAVSRPETSLAALTGELADLQARLDLLDAGVDPATQVRAVFSWSCSRLGPEAARTFRLAGLHPGPDIEPRAAAALTGATVQEARQELETLARAHLLSPAAAGRYTMHDLLRGYARELAGTADTAEDRHAALTRLFDYYLHTAAAAMDTLSPADRHRRPRIDSPAVPVVSLADPVTAGDWLDRERACLVAAAGYAAAHGWPGHTLQLAAILADHLHDSGHLADARAISSDALSAARRTGDRAAEAAALIRIGQNDWRHNRDQQAADSFRQALALYRAAGDRAGEARALGNLALAEKDLGHHELAVRCQQEALAVYHDLGDLTGEARGLSNLGQIRHQQGRYDEAVGYFRQALDLSRALDDPTIEAMALARLGVADMRQGRYQDAAGYLRQSVDRFREMGTRLGEGEQLARLGEVHVHLGRYEEATRYYEETLAMGRELGLPTLEAEALYGLGNVRFQTGDTAKARANYSAALRFESSGAAPWQLARAHIGLARVCERDGDAVQARHHWQEALTRYTAIGAPEASEIREILAAAGSHH
jgi:DNA-binding SARP family transcriptional activator/Tfp pilus assembly protein PilF